MIKISKLLGLRKKPQPEETSVPAEMKPDIWQQIESGEIDEGELYNELNKKDSGDLTDDEEDFLSFSGICHKEALRVNWVITELLRESYSENLNQEPLDVRHYENPFIEVSDFLILTLPKLLLPQDFARFANYHLPTIGGFVLREVMRWSLKIALGEKKYSYELKLDIDGFKSKIPEGDFPFLRRISYDHEKLHNAYAEMINAIALLFIGNFQSKEQRKHYVPFYFKNMAINLFSAIDKQLQDPLLSNKLSNVPIIRDWWKIINESRAQKKQKK